MKKRVELSSYCWIISSLTVAFICGVFLATVKTDNHLAAYIWGAAVIVLILSALFFMPLSISLDYYCLRIRKPLKSKSIPLSDIADVRLCPPTMGAKKKYMLGCKDAPEMVNAINKRISDLS